MIGVIDYEAGNIASVTNALEQIQAEYIVSSDATVLEKCRGIILPGVGAAPGAMKALAEKPGLIAWIKATRKPLLGICLGMQLLYEFSEEKDPQSTGPTQCLGVIPGTITLLDARAPKVPHMGWNSIEKTEQDLRLLSGIEDGEFFYFANSYYAPQGEWSAAVTNAGVPLTAVVGKENFLGVQFHPEKSGPAGLRLLKNFESLCRSSRH